jgi:hypothetical protein
MVTILIKPLLYLMAFGQAAVLFASAIGLACWLLMRSVRATEWLLTTGRRPRSSGDYLRCTYAPTNHPLLNPLLRNG